MVKGSSLHRELFGLIAYFLGHCVCARAWDALIRHGVLFDIHLRVGLSCDAEAELPPMWVILIEITLGLVSCGCWSVAYHIVRGKWIGYFS